MFNSNYRNLIENLYEGLFYVDIVGRIKFWSKGAEKITGYAWLEVMDRLCSEEFLCPVNAEGKKFYGEEFNMFTSTLLNGVMKKFELLITHKDGHQIPVAIRVAPMYDVKDSIVGATLLFTDSREHLEQLVFNSEDYQNTYIDKITKLPNKVSLETSIDFKLNEFRRYNRPFGILLFEIDKFEKLVSIYGDEFNENVLAVISTFVVEDLRPFDIAGRWSEKEFAIILINVREDSVELIGNRLKDMVEKSEFTIGKGTLDLTISISGIVATPIDSPKMLIEKLQDTVQECFVMGGNKFLPWSPVKRHN